jgi:hypothetical protein
MDRFKKSCYVRTDMNGEGFVIRRHTLIEILVDDGDRKQELRLWNITKRKSFMQNDKKIPRFTNYVWRVACNIIISKLNIFVAVW